MIRSVLTLIYAIVIAALVIAAAVFAAVWIIGMGTKAALFGEPRASLIMKLLERAGKAGAKADTNLTDISDITP